MEYSREELNAFDVFPEGTVIKNFLVLRFLEESYIPNGGFQEKRTQQYMCKCLNCDETQQRSRRQLLSNTKKACQYCDEQRVKPIKEGTQFGRLTVIGVDEASKYKNGKLLSPNKWKFVCECSCTKHTRVSVRRYSLLDGQTKSCGCLQKEYAAQKCISLRKTNPIEVCGDITKIFFFNAPGEYAIIDTEDYDKVKDFCWCKNKGYKNVFYATTSVSQHKYTETRMHQIICPCEEGYRPDHADGDGLNNRKSNLRPVTKSENAMNTKIATNNSSGITGVYWHKKGHGWTASITIEKKQIHLGLFQEKLLAIKARYFAEKKYFKDKARNWKLKYTHNQEILDLVPWLEEEYEKQKEKQSD